MSENHADPVPPTPPVPPVTPVPPAVPPKRKRGRLKRFLIGAVIIIPILLVLLALLLPTLLSLGPVRALALSIAGPKIAPNGKVQIDSWSFSWLGGQRISGITLLDDKNAAVAHLNVETGATLLGLARGNLNVGDTKVTGDFDIRIDPDTNKTNLEHILGLDAPKSAEKKTEPTPGPKKDDGPPPATQPASPITVPDIKGTVAVKMTGTISSTDPNDKRIPFTKVEQADLSLDLNDLDRGVALDGTVRANVDGKPARVAIKGTADAIENHVVLTDADKIAADLSLAIENLDLAIAKLGLAAAKVEGVDVAGLMKGKIAVKLQPGQTASIRATDGLGIDNLVLVAPQLKGDTLTLKRIDLPLEITRDAASLIAIKTAGLRSDLVTVDVSGGLPQQVLQNLIDKKSPGGAGQIVVRADAPSYAAIAKMLPHVVALPADVTVTGGGLTNTLTIDLTPDAAKATTALALNAAGTKAGKSIELGKTTLNASADVAIPAGQVVGAKEVRGFSIDLAAPFATVKGGGKIDAVRLEGDADLTRLYDDVAAFVAVKDLDLKGKLGFALATTGDPTDAAQTLGVKLGFNATGLTLTNAGKSLLADDAINGDVAALYKATDTSHVVTLSKLDVKSATGLLAASIGEQPLWVALPKDTASNAKKTIGGQGELNFRSGQLPRFAKMAATQPADPATELTSGVLNGVVRFGAQEGGSNYDVSTTIDLTKLTVGNVLKNETLKLDSKATVAADVSAAKATFNVASNFATLAGDADARLAASDPNARPLSTFEMLRAVNAAGNANLPKLYALATSVSPPAVTMDPVTNQPLPPMRIDGGDLAFKLAVARDDAKRLTSVKLDVPGIDKLQISRGKNAWSPEAPVTLALSADLTTDDAKATVTEQLQRAVATLDAQVPGVLSAKTTTPIDVTNLAAATPDAKGALTATARLAPLGRLLAAVSGGEPMAIDGDAKFDQKIASAGNGVSLVGGGTITELNPTGPEAKPLPENLRTIQLTNDLSADLKAMSATIKNLAVLAPQARDAFALTAAGTVKELGTNNVFDGLNAKFAYDWSQLWPLVQPFVDPTGQSIGKIDPFVGKYEKTFAIGGRYPTKTADGTAIPFNEAIRYTVVSGDLQIDRLTLAEKGVDIADFALPISLKDGVATIAYANGSSPKPFGVNSGRGDIGGLAVNLAGAEPVLLDVTNKKLVDGATLNPIMANALGKFFNPIFPNATKANAKVEVTLTSKDLHLGESLKTRNSGSAKVVLSLLNLEIANPLSEQLLGGAVNQIAKLTGSSGVDTETITNLQGELRDATFTLDRGVVKQDVTFMLGNEARADAKDAPKRYAFGFSGDVRLSDLGMNLNASFPMALLKDKLRGDVGKFLQYAPDSFPLAITGSTTAPKLDQSAFFKAIADSVVKSQITAAVAGKDGGDGKKSDADKIGGILGGVLSGKSPAEIAAEAQKQAEAEKAEKRTQSDKRDQAESRDQADRRDQAEKRDQADRRDQADKKARDDTPPEPEKKTQAQKRREAEQRQREEDERKAAEEKKAADDKRKAAQKKAAASDDDDPPAKKKKKDDGK